MGRGGIEGRLARLEASVRGTSACPGCGLRPQDKGHIVVEGVVEGEDPAPELPEVCPECGHRTRIRIRVEYEDAQEAAEGGGGHT